VKELSECYIVYQTRRKKGFKQFRFQCLNCNEQGRWKKSIEEAYAAGWYHDDFLIFTKLSGSMGAKEVGLDARQQGLESSSVAHENRRHLEEQP